MSRSVVVRMAALSAAWIAMSGVAQADTFDNPMVAAPITNNAITVDGNLSDWGTAGTNYTSFGPWNQWYDGSYGGVKNIPKNGSVTTSRMAINTATNRLIIGVQTTEPQAAFELNGLFGTIGTASIEGQNTRRTGQGPSSTGTQLSFTIPAGVTAGATALSVGQDQVLTGGAQTDGTASGVSGVVGSYRFDGTTTTIELSVPIKKDWTSADVSAANTYDLSTLRGLNGTGVGTLNVAYNISDFYAAAGYTGGDAQAARFNDATTDGTAGTSGPTYGNTKFGQDFWQNRAINSLGTGPNSLPGDDGAAGGKGGLTLVGAAPVPEPGTLALLGMSAIALISRRRRS